MHVSPGEINCPQTETSSNPGNSLSLSVCAPHAFFGANEPSAPRNTWSRTYYLIRPTAGGGRGDPAPLTNRVVEFHCDRTPGA